MMLNTEIRRPKAEKRAGPGGSQAGRGGFGVESTPPSPEAPIQATVCVCKRVLQEVCNALAGFRNGIGGEV